MQASAKSTLSSLVEEHLSLLIREAISVQRHAKRARFHQTTEHDGVLRKRLHAEDINLALQWRGSEKLYATGTVVPTVEGSTKKVDLNAYIKSEMQLRAPSEVALTMHWLAVDGNQPDIPQNPSQVNSIVHRITDDDDDLEGVRVRQLLPRLLSEELQLYFTHITMAVEQGGATPDDRRSQDSVLDKVAQDTGLQELVPFFVSYLCKQLYSSLGNPDHCRILIRLTRSLLLNPHLHLELHLHQLFPALMTCVVAKKLANHRTDNHWALRQEAASTLLQACNLFGEEYASLKARVLKALCEATAPEKALTTCFGGLVAITLFGIKAVDAFLLPLAIPYIQQWDKALESSDTDLNECIEIERCQWALLNGLTLFLSKADIGVQAERFDYEPLEEAFGERLVPLRSEPDEYAICFI